MIWTLYILLCVDPDSLIYRESDHVECVVKVIPQFTTESACHIAAGTWQGDLRVVTTWCRLDILS